MILAGMLLMTATGCWEKSASSRSSGPIYRAHFVGVDAILQGSHATTFQKIWQMPASAQLREETLQKLARAPFGFWKMRLPAAL